MRSILQLLAVVCIASVTPACTSQPQASTEQPASNAAASVIQSSDLSDTESIARANLTQMVSEQFTIYGTQAQFSTVGDDFRGGFPPADNNYNYQIVRATPTKVYMIATANQLNLRSFSGQVFVIPEAKRAEAYNNSPISGSICVTNTPSPSAPAEPDDATVAEPPCPSGSSSMGVLYPQKSN
jgi:hypothetical protein